MVEEYSDESIATGQTTSTWHKEIVRLVVATMLQLLQPRLTSLILLEPVV